MSWKQTALDVKDASDYLTDQVRYFVYNKRKIYMDNYFEEANVTRRRDKAIDIISTQLPDTIAHQGLDAAVTKSKELMNVEFYAMRLVVETLDPSFEYDYEEVKSVQLTDEDIAKSNDEKVALALDYVIGEDYLDAKTFINEKVNLAVSEIDTMMEKSVISSTSELKNILVGQQILIALNLVIITSAIFILYRYMIRPIGFAIDKLKNEEFMNENGMMKEFAYFATVYNKAKEQSNNIKDKLQYEAEHDQLTSLYNRTGYDTIYRRAKLEHCYYVLIDIDFFKEINDQNGHEVGDKVLVKVASTINKVFKEDYEFAFRLGGDEFAVLVEHNDNIPIEDVVKKCEQITNEINHKGNKIPEVTLSIGIAKGEESDTTDSLFRKADKALYSAKNNGRHNITIYSK